MDIGVGLSTKKDPPGAAKEALKLASARLQATKIDLAIVFCSTDLASHSLLETINLSLQNVPVIGLSGAAIISDEGVFENGIILILLSFSKDIHFCTAYSRNITSRPALSCGEELGEKLLHGFKNLPRNLSLIFLDRLIEDSSEFIHGLQERLGRSFPCICASAADSAQSIRTSLFFNRGIVNDGCAGILWGGRMNFGFGTQHGWKPLGKPHIVTASSGNIVQSIDGESAIKLYEEYLFRDVSKLKKDLKRLSLSYPIGVFIEGEQEYLLRNILGIGENGSLICQGNVPQASTIRLMISTKETCLEATRQAVEEAKKNLSGQTIKFSKEKTAKMAIAFSSVSRYTLLRREAKKELEIIKDSLGPDTPIIGLYTNGILAPLKASSYRGETYFHNQTFSILIIEG